MERYFYFSLSLQSGRGSVMASPIIFVFSSPGDLAEPEISSLLGSIPVKASVFCIHAEDREIKRRWTVECGLDGSFLFAQKEERNKTVNEFVKSLGCRSCVILVGGPEVEVEGDSVVFHIRPGKGPGSTSPRACGGGLALSIEAGAGPEALYAKAKECILSYNKIVEVMIRNIRVKSKSGKRERLEVPLFVFARGFYGHMADMVLMDEAFRRDEYIHLDTVDVFLGNKIASSIVEKKELLVRGGELVIALEKKKGLVGRIYKSKKYVGLSDCVQGYVYNEYLEREIDKLLAKYRGLGERSRMVLEAFRRGAGEEEQYSFDMELVNIKNELRKGAGRSRHPSVEVGLLREIQEAFMFPVRDARSGCMRALGHVYADASAARSPSPLGTLKHLLK